MWIIFLFFSLFFIFNYLCLFIISTLCLKMLKQNILTKHFCRKPPARSICWFLAVCVKHRCIKLRTQTVFNPVLQGWSRITSSKYNSSMWSTRSLCHLLQRKTWWIFLPWRISKYNYVHGALWSRCTRYMNNI